MKEKCRHHIIHVSRELITCAGCGKVWLHDKGMIFKDMSFRAGGVED